MGGFISEDVYVGSLLQQLNMRFATKEGIEEMQALQREFEIFSDAHSLRAAFALLNIGFSHNPAQTRGWYDYLDSLNQSPSDRKGITGSARVMTALKQNLEPTPPAQVSRVYFMAHDSNRNKGVKVSPQRTELVYSMHKFLTISLPMTPIQKSRAARRSKK